MHTTTINDLMQMESRSRANLINSLSGYKSPMLLGSGHDQSENLALFSNIFHIGSHPPLIGLFFRPDEGKQTLKNILKYLQFSLNFINQDQIKSAHQTSARYPENISEFEKTDFTSIYYKDSSAPFISESPLSLGLSFKEKLDVESNKTSIVIAQIDFIKSHDTLLENEDFHLEKHSDVAVKGLDTYYFTQKLYQLSYAKPDSFPKEIS